MRFWPNGSFAPTPVELLLLWRFVLNACPLESVARVDRPP